MRYVLALHVSGTARVRKLGSVGLEAQPLTGSDAGYRRALDQPSPPGFEQNFWNAALAACALRLYQAVLEAPFRPSKTFLNESEFANAIVVPQTPGIINAEEWQMSNMTATVIIRDTLKMGCASNMLLTCETILG
jgi:hypothetical protein